MKKINVSAVNYTNSKPFIFGLQNSAIIKGINLSLDIPSDCAQKLIDNKVDIGLIPVAAILSLPYWEIVSDYCIGASGAVDSVFIFSNCPIEEVRFIQLDPESRSSNNLAKVLIKNYWKLKPQFFEHAIDYGSSSDEQTAYVQIGDRTFGKKKKYPHVYDMAEEWLKFTGFPFVFAAWIANKPIPVAFIKQFNEAMKYGLNHRDVLFETEMTEHADFDVKNYLMHQIEYDLTDEKKVALTMFLDFVRAL